MITDVIPRWLAGLLIVLLLSACAGGADTRDLLDRLDDVKLKSSSGRHTVRRNSDEYGAAPARSDADARKSRHAALWEARSTGEPIKKDEAPTHSAGPATITLNLVEVPIRLAAKTVFADHLHLNYAVSDRVEGKITLQTTAPIDREALMDAFEAAIKMSGAVISDKGGTLWIVPAASTTATVNVGRNAPTRPGAAVQVIPIKYASARSVAGLVEPLLAKGAVVRVDDTRNLLIVNGSRAEISSALDTISVFDVNWMQGMSMSMVPVEASDPETIVAEIEKTLGMDKASPLKGTLRLIPNRRLRAVLLIAPSSELIDNAKAMLTRFDQLAEKRERQLFVYQIRNRSARELADLLKSVLDGTTTTATAQIAPARPTGDTPQVAPRFSPVEIANASGSRTGLQATAALTTGAISDVAAATTPPSLATSSPADGNPLRTSVIADEANNSLLIQTYPSEYRRIRRMLEQMDATPVQVLLESVIAEVTLNDELKFGLKWYFQRKQSEFTFTDAAKGLVASTFPGFSYFFGTNNVQVALDALSGVTKVNVVSAPSLVVMDRHKATLQVGDQVPIVSQTAQSVAQPGAPVINTVNMRDTGVILNVTPRVNERGRVILDIEQEVSNVARTTTSGIDSPTIQQRRIKTTVTVFDGQAVALGGLIQQNDSVGNKQVPILGNIPVLGMAFRQKEDVRSRTELVVFIQPKVMRDAAEARSVFEEYRDRMSNIQPVPMPKGMPHVRDLGRIAR